MNEDEGSVAAIAGARGGVDGETGSGLARTPLWKFTGGTLPWSRLLGESRHS